VNATDVQRYKRLLLAKRDELTTRRHTASSPAPGANLQGDSGDQASADAEADLTIRLRQTDIQLLRAIENALRRVTQDRFGVCEECGTPISKARLEAIPWTPLCRDCMEQEQSAA
jgi:RNA polymerase-binding transcription factor